MRRLVFVLLAFLVALAAIAGMVPRLRPAEGEPIKIKDLLEVTEQDRPALRARWFYEQRAYPQTFIQPGARLRAWMSVEAQREEGPQTAALGSSWTAIGPAPTNNGQTYGTPKVPVTGRVTALAPHPTNPNILYLGAAQGGVWKTTNALSPSPIWTPLTDQQASLAVGAIAVDPNNGDIIYVGTGESNYSCDSYFGAGILKSTNGGATWSLLGAAQFDSRSISRIAINPSNTQEIWVSSTSGIGGVGCDRAPTGAPDLGLYRSTNGGASFSPILTGVGATDVLLDPNNPGNVFAAFVSLGIYRKLSTDSSFTQLTSGLPSSNFGDIRLAASASQPGVFYAAFARNNGEVYRTTNYGATWSRLPALDGFCGGQCNYDMTIDVDPVNGNYIYLGGSANNTNSGGSLYRSSNGGTSMVDISTGSGTGGLHADTHAFAFLPSDHNTIFTGNDGGVWRSTNNGTTWQHMNTNLAITQFTGVALHPTNPLLAIGGTQDNGTQKYSGSNAWSRIDFGDGGFAAIDQSNPLYMYHTYFNLAGVFIGLARSDDGGTSVDLWTVKNIGINQNDRVLFYAPFTLDPNNQATVYFGTHRLYRSTNRGDTFSPISGDLTRGNLSDGRRHAISAIAVAPSNSQTIYVGTSDGKIQRTNNGGSAWTDVSAGIPDRFVSRLAVHPSITSTVYATVSGFGSGHVWKSTTGGNTWTNVSDSLPDIPVNAIVLDTTDPTNVYIGTDLGVWRSTTGGGGWVHLTNGMPNVAVFDLKFNPTTNVLLAATHGRSVFQLNESGSGSPTPTPSATVTPTPTGPTRTPTRTPTITRTPTATTTPRARVRLPIVERQYAAPTATATSTHTPTATATVSGGLQIIATQNFEGVFPGNGWVVSD